MQLPCRIRLYSCEIAWCLFLIGLLTCAVPVSGWADEDPALPDGTAEATKRLSAFRVPTGMKVELFAAEPQLASPVALTVDEQGRVFVAEEYRFNRGTEENRTRPFLLEDDLQIRTLEDRLAVFQKWASRFDGGMSWFSRFSDKVRLLEDRDRDGKAEISTVFADGFNDPLDGLAAGVLVREGDVYLTCIPNLWRLRDTNGDGKADQREVIARGFGVNCGFLGHDLHGLVWGPDGKLYFSVGDRGFHITTKEGATLSGPRVGAVFRCRPDGSQLEVVYRGLRNPQEIAFDQYGRLFAADNNCDKGDHSRLVYILDGGDSGWNMSYQSIADPYLTGPWHAERLWHLPHATQPAWIVPPAGRLGAGPSGFTYYPGTGLSKTFDDHFFLCNYTGNGGIETFAVKSKGAGFELVDQQDFLKPIFATDAEFGYDGKLYVSDFVNLDWSGRPLGGRVYTVTDVQQGQTAAVKQVQELFATGFSNRSDSELGGMLAHPDMRVRLRAQFVLAERGASTIPQFEAALASQATVHRLHGMWGLGQLASSQGAIAQRLIPLLEDADPILRAQTAKTLGDIRCQAAEQPLIRRLQDTDNSVRALAAQSLGALKSREAVAPLIQTLRDNNDVDPWLRHTATHALALIDDRITVYQYLVDTSPAVRRGVLLVLRKWSDPRIAELLQDSDLLIATEAARAINDLPIEASQIELANCLIRYQSGITVEHEPLLRRAINAGFRLGNKEYLSLILQIVTNEGFPLALRREALMAVKDWQTPGARDRVTGFWRPLSARPAETIRPLVESHLPILLARSPEVLQSLVLQLASQMGLTTSSETLTAWVNDGNRPPLGRVAALRFLVKQESTSATAVLSRLLNENSIPPVLRGAARDELSHLDPVNGLKSLQQVLSLPSAPMTVIEQQQAFTTLAKLPQPEARILLSEWGDRLASGTVAPALQLDVWNAIHGALEPAIKTSLDKVNQQDTAHQLGRFRLSLEGGDPERGRSLFMGHSAAQCVRCHRVGMSGGTAGPDLTQVAKRHPRDKLLLSLVEPNAEVAPGFGSVAVQLTSGQVVGGILKEEKPEHLLIETPDRGVITIPRSEIDEVSPARSAMPEMKKVLTPEEVRDLVAYLAELK